MLQSLWLPLTALLALIGFADATYLSLMHFQNADVGCSVITGCDAVLSSEYATIFGIPLSYLGVLYYLSILFGSAAYYQTESELVRKGILAVVISGALFSGWLIYLQAFVILAFCQFCLISAASTFGMLGLLIYAIKTTKDA